MLRQLPGLVEGCIAPRIAAPVGIVACVDVLVVPEVLLQSEFLVAESATEFRVWIMKLKMPIDAVAVGVGLLAPLKWTREAFGLI